MPENCLSVKRFEVISTLDGLSARTVDIDAPINKHALFYILHRLVGPTYSNSRIDGSIKDRDDNPYKFKLNSWTLAETFESNYRVLNPQISVADPNGIVRQIELKWGQPIEPQILTQFTGLAKYQNWEHYDLQTEVVTLRAKVAQLEEIINGQAKLN